LRTPSGLTFITHAIGEGDAAGLPRVGAACETLPMGIVVRIVVNAFAIWIVTLIPALKVTVIPFPPGGVLQEVLTFLIVGAIFALVNLLIGTVLRVLAFPIYIITLGFFSLIVNGFLLWLTAWLTHWWSWGLRVEDFWWGILAALVITLINWVAGIFFRPKRRA
jgi:putative membrane protein